MPGMERKDLIEKNAEGYYVYILFLLSYNSILLFFSYSDSNPPLHCDSFNSFVLTFTLINAVSLPFTLILPLPLILILILDFIVTLTLTLILILILPFIVTFRFSLLFTLLFSPFLPFPFLSPPSFYPYAYLHSNLFLALPSF